MRVFAGHFVLFGSRLRLEGIMLRDSEPIRLLETPRSLTECTLIISTIFEVVLVGQRRSLLWRRFGYVILIIIKFGELLLWISPRIVNALRSYIKHSKECSSDIETLRRWSQKLDLHSVFEPTSQCLGIWWNSLPCVWYITRNLRIPEGWRKRNVPSTNRFWKQSDKFCFSR